MYIYKEQNKNKKGYYTCPLICISSHSICHVDTRYSDSLDCPYNILFIKKKKKKKKNGFTTTPPPPNYLVSSFQKSQSDKALLTSNTSIFFFSHKAFLSLCNGVRGSKGIRHKLISIESHLFFLSLPFLYSFQFFFNELLVFGYRFWFRLQMERSR